jgi:chitobiase/beta-hexosaminidase-like protein
MKMLLGLLLVLVLGLLTVGCPSPTQPDPDSGDPATEDPTTEDPAADPPVTQVAAPVFSPDPAAGPFDSTLSVGLSSATEGATIYYNWTTINPADPDQNATPFVSPISVLLTGQYAAIAYKDGLDPSPVTNVTFTINPVSLPISDNFEDGDASGWTLTGGIVDTSMGANATTASVRLTGSSSNLELHLRGASAATVQFDIRTDSAASNYGVGYLYNLSMVDVGFGSGGKFALEGTDLTASYVADTWYEIRLEFDYVNGNMDLYIDDAIEVTDHFVIDTEHAGIAFIGSDNAEIWIDEISIQ